MNILIVDDQYINRYLLEKILTGYGYSVFSAENGYDALEIAERTQLDLIISDILLPKMDGFQFCREIKNNLKLRNIPFVFYTAAYTEKKDQDFAVSLGADRFIIKPTDPVEFITIIRELLSDIPHSPDSTINSQDISNDEFFSEYSRRLFHQLEKKLIEVEEMNKALRVSEERYKNLFEQANDAIFLYEIAPNGMPGHILEVNGVACRTLGYSRDELLLMNFSDIDSPAMKDQLEKIYPKLLTLGHLTFEGEHVARMKQIIPVEINAHLYPDPRSCLCLSICRDITARKKIEVELTHAFHIIDKNLLKMAILNDKIRNPLAIILSSCETCKGNMQEQVNNAVNTIHDMISQIDNGWVESEKVRKYLHKYYKIEEEETPEPEN